ncbi:MAG: 3-oxoacyl-[acyl-carrier-protein] synthase-3 [Salibacteraceae bacterium]|jgi:3-oxoacyl-[acyl-carrier-protein] synthase-3
MVGIKEIGTYLPEQRISNYDRLEKFDTNADFIENKIGIVEVALKSKEEETSDLGVKAFENLESKIAIDKSKIEVLIVVTQNPDSNIPHTSSVVHKKLALPESCAAFDISLGCSGFVYGISIIKGFMESNGFTQGVLITSDPYSKIINQEDKNTSLLFGDGATATLMTTDPVLDLGKFTFGTIGKEGHNLVCTDGELSMNGRSIFNFAARYVPGDVVSVLAKNNCSKEDIDVIIFHQGSKYILDTLIRRTGFAIEKVVNDVKHYGNTVSSSIPMILAKELKNVKNKKILISGFGVGLSWSSSVLTRK